jgi:PHP family Zn ribbon phosphoesterase
MSPKKIVPPSHAVGRVLHAHFDQNTAENPAATMREGKRQGLQVLPGMEICSKEEVHILALFDELEPTLEMQTYVDANLPGENKTEVFGFQVIANEQDEVIGENPRLLIGATRLGLHGIVDKTHVLGGINISCHVDRPAYGIINQLGFIPEDLNLDGLEVSYRIKLAEAAQTIPGVENFSFVTASDAHFLNDIGKTCTVFKLAEPSLAEIRLALAGKNGRRIVV